MAHKNYDTLAQACRELLAAFFDRFPDEQLQLAANSALELLLAKDVVLSGKPAGWAGGLVYALGCKAGIGIPGVLNSELEAIFGVSVGTISKRAKRIWDLMEPELLQMLSNTYHRVEFTIRDEANTICAYTFRNGYIENIHASVDSSGQPRITDPEMKELMIQSCRKLAELLEMKQSDPGKYEGFIRDYNRKYCYNWER